MNWKILGKSLLITIGVLCVIGAFFLIVAISPLWVSMGVSIAGVVFCVFYYVYTEEIDDQQRKKRNNGTNTY